MTPAFRKGFTFRRWSLGGGDCEERGEEALTSTFQGVTLSGTDRRTAKYGGTPISPLSKKGSGEMTERHAKLTRLPIMFFLKSPSFFSNSCLIPCTLAKSHHIKKKTPELVVAIAIITLNFNTCYASPPNLGVTQQDANKPPGYVPHDQRKPA